MEHSKIFSDIRKKLESKYFVYFDLENNVIQENGRKTYMAQFVKYRNDKIYEYNFECHCFVYEDMYQDPSKHFPWQYYKECSFEELQKLKAPVEAKILLMEGEK